ncbi:MAG: nuclease-related domain-containing protein [Chloroflexota bacterium]
MFKQTTNAKNKRNPLKDRPLRYPAQSLDEEIKRLQMEVLTYAVYFAVSLGLAFVEWSRWYGNLQPQPIPTTIAAAVFVSYSYFKIRQLKKRIRNTKLGRDGEREVGQSLEELRQKGYAIFHDIVGGDFNIDHVVVSRRGIFAVETKTKSKPKNGRVTFDGKSITLTGEKPDDKPIQQAIAVADWLRDSIQASTGKRFPVTPVVVFPGWYVEETSADEKIWVLNPYGLAIKIPQKSQTLTQEDVHLIAFHLSRLIKMSYPKEEVY